MQRLVVHLRQDLVKRLGPPARERRLEVRHLDEPWPDVWGRGAEKSAHSIERQNPYIYQMALGGRTHRNVLKIWSISESPGIKGTPEAISAKMVPHDQTST